MSQTKHTPGPWCAIEYSGYHEIQSEPFYGAANLLDEEGCPEAPHNVRLAAAAPELLEALYALSERYEQELGDGYLGGIPELDAAQAAIRKATAQ